MGFAAVAPSNLDQHVHQPIVYVSYVCMIFVETTYMEHGVDKGRIINLFRSIA